MELVIDILSWISLMTGGFFLLIGSLGMIRLPDFWSRLHAASIIDSAGLGLILLGLILQAGFTFVTVKLFLIVIFLLITGPTASHAVANAAFVSGSRPLDMVEDQTGSAEIRDDTPALKTKKKAAKSTAKPKTRKGKA